MRAFSHSSVDFPCIYKIVLAKKIIGDQDLVYCSPRHGNMHSLGEGNYQYLSIWILDALN
jgi:hypothetical protein